MRISVASIKRNMEKVTEFFCDYQVFTREEVQEGEEIGQTVIKMTNTKLGISTFWTMDKFEDKLIQMREMFQVWALRENITTKCTVQSIV